MLNRLLHSSVDPEKIALTIKAGVPFIVFLLPFFKVVNIGENELAQLADSLGAVILGVFALYGLGRKLYFEGSELYAKVSK